jgi:hypothetical protein
MRGHDAGSTMDAMSDAIEGADVMLYGVSLKYKESANVRIAHTRTAAAADEQRSSWCLRLTLCSCVFALAAAVPNGSQLCSPARAGDDTDDGAEGLLAKVRVSALCAHGIAEPCCLVVR